MSETTEKDQGTAKEEARPESEAAPAGDGTETPAQPPGGSPGAGDKGGPKEEAADVAPPGSAPGEGKAAKEPGQEQEGDGKGPDADEEDAGDVPSDEDIEQVQELYQRVKAEIAEKDEQVLRAKAEVANITRRKDEQVRLARTYAVTGFAAELLTVRDALDATLRNRESGKEALIEGVELTLRQLDKVFESENISVIEPKEGDPFDPELHQAMAQMESDKMGPNMVVGVIAKGYRISDRLLRPAQVAVSKAPAAKDAATEAGNGDGDGKEAPPESQG